MSPASEYAENMRMGTTLRFYDPRTDAWHVGWSGPMRGSLMTFTGRKIGEEIVMEVGSVQGLPRMNSSDAGSMHRGRWIFDLVLPFRLELTRPAA